MSLATALTGLGMLGVVYSRKMRDRFGGRKEEFRCMSIPVPAGSGWIEHHNINQVYSAEAAKIASGIARGAGFPAKKQIIFDEDTRSIQVCVGTEASGRDKRMTASTRKTRTAEARESMDLIKEVLDETLLLFTKGQ